MTDYAGTLAGSGLNAYVNIGLEPTFESAVTTSWAGLVDECSFTRENTIYENRGIMDRRTVNSQTNIATRYPVSLGGKVDCGIPLSMIMGYISATTDPTCAVFKGDNHIAATPNTSYLPSWAVHRTYVEATDDSVSITGVTWNTGDYNIELDGEFTYSLEGVGKSQATTAAVTKTSPATALGSWNTTVSAEAAASYTSGTAVKGLKNAGFTVNNNLLVRNSFGTTAPVAIRQPIPGRADLEFRLGRGAVDDDMWDILCDGTVNSFNVTATDGTTSLDIDVNSTYCKSIVHRANLDDQSEETALFSAKDIIVVVADGETYVKYGVA